MDFAEKLHARVVDRVAVQFLPVEVVGVAEPVVGLVGRPVGDGSVTLVAQHLGGVDVLLVLCVVDGPVRLAAGRPCCERVGDAGPDRTDGRLVGPVGPDGVVDRDRGEGSLSLSLCAGAHDLFEHLGRHDEADATTVRGAATRSLFHVDPPCTFSRELGSTGLGPHDAVRPR